MIGEKKGENTFVLGTVTGEESEALVPKHGVKRVNMFAADILLKVQMPDLMNDGLERELEFSDDGDS